MGKPFGYYKLECNDLDVIRETLSKEQGFDLICALVDYSRDGTITELPAELRIPFAMLKKKVDQAHKVYEDKCNMLRDHASKGGKQKAKNRERAIGTAPAQVKKFKPPTKAEFKNAVRKVVEDSDFDKPDSYDIESFFDSLVERSWIFEGMPIQSRKDWEEIIYARFHDPLSYDDERLNISYYDIFCYVLSTYPQLHYRWDDVDSILSDLIYSCWKNGTWNVKGSKFEKKNWKSALDALAAEWIEDIPP